MNSLDKAEEIIEYWFLRFNDLIPLITQIIPGYKKTFIYHEFLTKAINKALLNAKKDVQLLIVIMFLTCNMDLKRFIIDKRKQKTKKALFLMIEEDGNNLKPKFVLQEFIQHKNCWKEIEEFSIDEMDEIDISRMNRNLKVISEYVG